MTQTDPLCRYGTSQRANRENARNVRRCCGSKLARSIGEVNGTNEGLPGMFLKDASAYRLF